MFSFFVKSLGIGALLFLSQTTVASTGATTLTAASATAPAAAAHAPTTAEPTAHFLKARAFLAQLTGISPSSFEGDKYSLLSEAWMGSDCLVKVRFSKAPATAYSRAVEEFSFSLVKSDTRSRPVSVQSRQNVEVNYDRYGFFENFKVSDRIQYDCEEEGCSQEAIVNATFSPTQFAVENVDSGKSGRYDFITMTCSR